MRAIIVRLWIVGAALGCGGREPEPSATISTPDDVRAVETVLRSWYDASERHDSAAWVAPLLPEFFIIEDTTRYDKESLARLVIESFAAGTDRAVLSDFHTVVAGDVAWTTFRNDEVFTPTGAAPMPSRRFLETVVFRRVAETWRMERYHATRINRATPPP